jgi:metal-responsive CopG/Arc/MetJ family transcriptional regulator
MEKDVVRTPVVLPPELVDEVDRLVGQRRRSQFFTEAAREKLARVRLVAAAHKAAGSLADVPTPEWESSEAAARWVRRSRRADDRRPGRGRAR